ncbi:heat shock 70 kDa protein 12A [Caerostris extrusa]|uniref:Heat shock 70 kDa protein 12A n=1 Tax=Caerostris extrusa TaxID=172846 RepID=A0AAV4VWN8_CAEEX|nr:heat shock 70 kDa protein 12A [Caerostris extrusa]
MTKLSKSEEIARTQVAHGTITDKTSIASKVEANASSDKLLEEIQNSKSLDKMSIKDPDVIDAIRVLDKSLMEISESTMGSDVDSLPHMNSETKSDIENNEKSNIKIPVKTVKEDKIQCDNLIEEFTLEGISKRVSNLSISSDSSSVLGGSIAVTISSTNTQQSISSLKSIQSLRIRKSDSDVEQNTENSDYWLSTRLSNSLRVSSTISDANSCADDSSLDACPSDFCETEDEMKKVNQVSNPKIDAFPFPASIISESPNAVYPLQVSVDHNSNPLLHNEVSCNQRTSPCSVDSGTSSHNQGFFVVVAIDFGTTYSGYAFSFTRDPDNIHMMKKWDEGTFHSFGYSARDYYHDLDEEEAKGWLYFEKFKMTLHHSEVSWFFQYISRPYYSSVIKINALDFETEIAAANGRRMPAVTVFAHALRYFKDHALQELSDQSATKILNEDVRWVVTVPAIWKQPAKQFMRAAAYKNRNTTYGHNKLSFFMLYLKVQYISNNISLDFSSSNLSAQGNDGSFTAGTRYMVVDCGGGTVDITVHELLDKQGTLKGTSKSIWGAYGAIGVDMEFEKLLCDIVGEDFIQQFKSKRPTGYVDLMIAFEARKRNANPYKTNPLNISLPYSFIEFYEKYKRSSVETAIKKSSHKNVKWSSQGMLRLEPSAMEGLFRRTVEKIRQHIESIINQKDIRIDHIFLVGGFAESLILQKKSKMHFPLD